MLQQFNMISSFLFFVQSDPDVFHNKFSKTRLILPNLQKSGHL